MTFLEKYEKADRASNEKLARQYLVDYLLSDNIRGDAKRVSLTSAPVEEMMPCAFVPSMFYTFLYLPKNADDTSMFDAIPLIMCTGFNGKIVTGLNFNILPNNVRASVLDVITGGYSEFYNGAGPDRPINNKLGSALIDSKANASIMRVLSEKTGLKIGNAIRTYTITNIRKPRMVEYDMLEYIPFLTFNDAIRGGALSAMQAGMISDNKK